MNIRTLTLTLSTAALLTTNTQAAFHLMQIEEIIGGVAGDNTAQAIQLRLRSAGNNIVSSSSIWAADASGSNRVLLLDIGANVAVSSAGARVLLSTASFTTKMNSTGGPAFSPDFTLASAIPASYLSGGRVTFEADGGSVSTPGTIYWSLTFGSYSGSNTGDVTNDSDGNFGSPTSALTTSTFKGVRFTGAANAASTTNVADYAATSDPATVTKNNGTAFTVVPEPGSAAFIGLGALAMFGVFSRRRRAQS